MTKRRDPLGINRRNLDFVFSESTPGRFRDLDDKVRGKRRLEEAGVAVPPTLGVIRTASDLDVLHDLLESHDELVVKPAHGSGGKGILVLGRDDGGWTTPGGRRLSPQQIEDHVLDALSGSFSLDESTDQVVLEERIHPHDFLFELYPHGLSDLRVVVEDGEPIQAMLRVPTNASDGRANLHGGGLGLGIDLKTGIVRHAVQGRRAIEEHPDTGTRVLGRTVPSWPECLEVARAAAEAFAEIRYLGVDIILDARRGPMVLEMNARPGLAIQVANREAQPVRRLVSTSRFERTTQVAAWIFLGLLFVLPIGFGLWQDAGDTEIRAVRIEREVEAEDEVTSRGGVEWSDDGIPVSSIDDRFAGAREAAALGDTAQALALYRESAADEALAPFALNNIALIHRESGALERALAVLDGALARFPDYARGVYNRGLILRDLGRLDEAEAAFDRALFLRPGYASAWSERGELSLKDGDFEAARKAFENAVRFDPDTVADRWRLGRTLLALDRPGEAATRFEESLALGGGRASVRDWIRARLAYADARGSIPTEDTFDSLVARLTPVALGPRVSTTIANLWGELLWRRGDVEGAAQWFARPEIDGQSVAALTLAIGLDLEQGRWDAAASRLEVTDTPDFDRWRTAVRFSRALERDDALERLDLSLDPLVALARDRVVAGDPIVPATAPIAVADAIEANWIESGTVTFDVPTPARIAAVDPGNPLPIPARVLAWWSRRAGIDPSAVPQSAFDDFVPVLRERFDDAMADASLEAAHSTGMQLVSLGAASTEVLVSLARIELDRDRPDLCRSVLESFPGEERSRPDVLRLEAALLRAEDREDEARRILERLAGADPTNPELLAELARVQSATGKRRSATSNWRLALQERPDRADWTAELADLLTDRGQYEEAVVTWEQAIELGLDDDTLESALFNRSLALQRLDRFEEAIRGWTALIERDPERRSAHFNRALAYEALDQIDQAIVGYRRVLEIDPDHVSSRRRLEELDPKGRP